MFLEEWSTSGERHNRPRLSHLRDLFILAGLYRAADFVAQRMLQEPPPARPSTGPAARVDITLPPDDDADSDGITNNNRDNIEKQSHNKVLVGQSFAMPNIITQANEQRSSTSVASSTSPQGLSISDGMMNGILPVFSGSQVIPLISSSVASARSDESVGSGISNAEITQSTDVSNGFLPAVLDAMSSSTTEQSNAIDSPVTGSVVSNALIIPRMLEQSSRIESPNTQAHSAPPSTIESNIGFSEQYIPVFLRDNRELSSVLQSGSTQMSADVNSPKLEFLISTFREHSIVSGMSSAKLDESMNDIPLLGQLMSSLDEKIGEGGEHSTE